MLSSIQNSINPSKILEGGKKNTKTNIIFEDLFVYIYWKTLQAPPFWYLASNLSFANTCITKMP